MSKQPQGPSIGEQVIGWLGLAVMVMFAIGIPMLLLGFSKEDVWPTSLVVALLFLALRPGGSASEAASFLLGYGITFSVWCVGGAMLEIVFHLVFDMERPATLMVVAAVGVFGVLREGQASKSDKNS
jgi:hypothetical protein